MTSEFKREARQARHSKTPEQMEQETQYKQWMKYVGTTRGGATDDLAIAEEEFEQAVSRDRDWETDKVWTGPSIPEEYLREIEASSDLQEEISNFQPADEEEAKSEFPPFILLPVPDVSPVPPDPEDLPKGSHRYAHSLLVQRII